MKESLLSDLSRRVELLDVRPRVDLLEQKLAFLNRQLDLLKSKTEISADEWHSLQAERGAASVTERPLVSVCVSTHNRVQLLTERCLPSILRQTYRNIEVIVVADGCEDDTMSAIRAIGDDRIKLHSIDRNPQWLEMAERRWMVSGSRANNVAQELASGDYITHLDDDDEHLEDRIEKLLDFAQNNGLDLVYHPFFAELSPGSWEVNDAAILECGKVTTSSIFYRRWIKSIRWDVDTHLLCEPADWNRIRRMIYAGAKHARYPEPLLRHYLERNQPHTHFVPSG
jgi:glycosyltransferase involved in cell wall biosynthesis